MLCSICIGVLKYRANRIYVPTLKPYIENAHHRTTQSLQSSAEEGCHVCFPLWNQLAQHEQEALRAAEKERMQEDEADLIETIDLGEWLTRTSLYPSEGHNEVFIFDVRFRHYHIDWESIVGGREPDPISHTLQLISVPNASTSHSNGADNTASKESWTHIPRWLNKCLSTHTKCNEFRKQNGWYPTRLLDFGRGEELNGRLRLIHTSREEMSGPYCTLSHCWGQAQFIRLDQESMSSLVSGFSVHQLPKTFKEAVEITRHLGVRYLWIDSLCIQQDDKSDWAREAGLMHKIYSHSYCNISASAAEDSTGGLFRERLPNLLVPTQVEVCVTDLGYEAHYMHCEMYDRDFWTRNVSECTINKRAWVLQERLLAHRVLHFGNAQIFWECMEHAACELYPNGLPEYYQTLKSTHFKALDAEKYRPRDSRPEDADYFIWSTIVGAYSRTLLTVASDKLIALSGIANKLAGRVNDIYVAGMWRRHLVPALLWWADGEKVDGSPSSRPSKYRAPTWSWASIDGIVDMEDNLVSEWRIQIVDYKLEYATHDITGIITGGWIDLRGHLKPFSLRWNAKGYLRCFKWQMALDGETVWSQDESIAEEDWSTKFVDLDVPTSNSEAFDEDNAQQRLYCLVSRAAKDAEDYVPILLLRLLDAERVLFERIGLASCPPGQGLAMLEAELPEDVKSNLPCSRYEDGLHTIRVV